jgi:ElaB/YqjD/DUF883 family membrane-anchored ribosome-binding protein
MKNKELMLAKIDRAKEDVTQAASELERLMRELSDTPRAEKTTVSRVMEDAFSKLRAARSDLADLENLIKSGSE